jgi:hypothetical protein
MMTYAKKRAAIFILLFVLVLALLGVTFYKAEYNIYGPILEQISASSDITASGNNPLILYPWHPTSPKLILPIDYRVPAVPGDSISIRACPGQFESATFVMSAQENLSNIVITASDLQSSSGDRLSSDNLDIRLVKVWYKAGKDIYFERGAHVLVPELLLKDDSLVKVDYTTQTNYLRVTINGTQQYVDISSPDATVPVNAEVYDASVLQPFSMNTGENKQVWITVHIPDTAQAGDYHGTITITPEGEPAETMNFTVTVLPFSLEPAPVEYALYYLGIISSNPTPVLSSDLKTPAQYSEELQDMKDHGISYPTLNDYNPDTVGTELQLRNQSGLPTDHIYLTGVGTRNSTDPVKLTYLGNEVQQWESITAQYGFNDIYLYGIDEGGDGVLQSEIPAWNVVHQNGGKVFVAVSENPDAVDIVGNVLDTAIYANALNSTQAAEWHSDGEKLFSYSNPQSGNANPLLYRNNYGFALWNAGYDGEMDFAYQWQTGFIWNNFDDPDRNYQDEVFAYPTSTGVIDTIQWEGFHEGVDDTRYVATLLKYSRDPASVKAMISDSLSNNEDPAQIRDDVINQTLLLYPGS